MRHRERIRGASKPLSAYIAPCQTDTVCYQEKSLPRIIFSGKIREKGMRAPQSGIIINEEERKWEDFCAAAGIP